MHVYNVYFAYILFAYLLDVCRYIDNFSIKINVRKLWSEVVRGDKFDKNNVMLAVRILLFLKQI